MSARHTNTHTQKVKKAHIFTQTQVPRRAAQSRTGPAAEGKQFCGCKLKEKKDVSILAVWEQVKSAL